MKSLKNFLLLSLVLIISTVVTSCQSASEKLAQQVDNARTMCPINIGPMASITNIEYNRIDNRLTYTVAVNDNAVPVEILSADTAMIANALLNAALSDQNNAELLELITDAQATLEIKYEGRNSGTSSSAVIEPAQIVEKAADAKPLSVDQWRESLLNSIELQSKALPQPMGPEMTMTAIAVDNNVICYTVTLTDKGAESLATSQRTPRQVKAAMLKMLHASKSAAQFGTLVKSTGMSLRYTFLNPEGATVMTVDIPNDEIK